VVNKRDSSTFAKFLPSLSEFVPGKNEVSSYF
jgi:hypothetical protein